MRVKVEFSVGHGVKNEVNQHVKSVKHKHAQEATKKTSTVCWITAEQAVNSPAD